MLDRQLYHKNFVCVPLPPAHDPRYRATRLAIKDVPVGISGNFPILLLRINDPQRLELVNEALKAHR